jgi:hypothetical protein
MNLQAQLTINDEIIFTHRSGTTDSRALPFEGESLFIARI